jgi:hypothetical protein
MNNAAVGAGGSGGNNISNATAGTELYGVNLIAGSNTSGAITINSIFNAGSTNSTTYNHTTNTLLYTASGANAPSTNDTTNTALVNHNLNISAITKAGQYTQSVTYTVIPVF